MTDKPSIEYEKLVRDVYQALHNAEYPGTVEVEHNKKLPGRSGCEHQIDVYWEVSTGGESFGVAIECKHYAKTVEVGVVRDFFGVLHDTGAKGIVVTKRGFQSGARKFAEHYRISLKEVRKPEGDDWTGRLSGYEVQAKDLLPHNFRLRPILDEEWFALKEVDLSHVDARIVDEGEAALTDERGTVLVRNLEDLIRDLVPGSLLAGNDQRVEREYPNAFIEHPKLGRLKIRGMELHYDVASSTATFKSEGEEIALAILKDVDTGRITFFDKHGGVK